MNGDNLPYLGYKRPGRKISDHNLGHNDKTSGKQGRERDLEVVGDHGDPDIEVLHEEGEIDKCVHMD
jgi:hypothetical protein